MSSMDNATLAEGTADVDPGAANTSTGTGGVGVVDGSEGTMDVTQLPMGTSTANNQGQGGQHGQAGGVDDQTPLDVAAMLNQPQGGDGLPPMPATEQQQQQQQALGGDGSLDASLLAESMGVGDMAPAVPDNLDPVQQMQNVQRLQQQQMQMQNMYHQQAMQQQMPQQIGQPQGQGQALLQGSLVGVGVGAPMPMQQPGQGGMMQAAAPKKEWHGLDAYTTEREKVRQSIVFLLVSKRPNPTDEWQKRLPQMAKRLEESLFRNANSLEEYRDESTLKVRLQQLALSMRTYNNKAGGVSSSSGVVAGGRGVAHLASAALPGMMAGQAIPGVGFNMGYNPQPGYASGVPNQQFLQNSGRPGMYGIPGAVGADGQALGGVAGAFAGGVPNQQQKQFVNMSAINPLMGVSNNNGGGGGDMSTTAPGMVNMHMQGVGGGGMAQGGAGADKRHSEEHRRAVLKQQQQRLLLLRHASKCRYENSQCPVTNHCRIMKDLWKHIMSCKDTKCTVPHCVSSRYVLSHYSKCKDQDCPVCGPVRLRIKKNFEQGQMIVEASRRQNGQSGMKGGHGQHMQQHMAQQQPRRAVDTALDPVSCAVYNFTDDEVRSHLMNIQEGMKMTASKIKELCMPIIDEFLKNKHGAAYFREAVDPVALQIPDYFEIVKIPMDLGTVKKRLESSSYRDTKQFERDTHLVFDNAMLYNPKQCEVHVVAKQFKRDFDNRLKGQLEKMEILLQQGRNDCGNCVVCGEGKLLFEPPVYHCNGKCGGQRIRRNSHFFTGGQDEYHWCASCFADLKDGAIKLPTGTLYKAEIAKTKRKHDVEVVEDWVACDVCDRWVHQICGMFNMRQNTSEELAYCCPYCLLERRKNQPALAKVKKTKMRAKDLAHTTMTRFLEERVRAKLKEKEDERAAMEGITDPALVERCSPVFVRVVSCVDKKHAVREGMAQRYAFKNYPVEFPVRTKCIVIFQKVDGQDVLIFGLYVYEYGDQCPQPNHRRVYISYLDSVNYFRPKHFRTPCYQELMVSYLDYVRARGFHTAHIWSCPPSKGDDYILYQHPSDQKTPKEDRLRAWYDEILADAKERGVVCEISDLFQEYCENKENDATVLPYFEGDYWVNEAEDIIKGVNAKSGGAVKASLALQNGTIEEEEKEEEEKEAGKATKSSNKRKQKRTRTTRSVSQAGFGIRDPVMARLADMVKKMRAALYVAKLRPEPYAKEKWDDRLKEIEKEEQESNESKRPKPGSAVEESQDVAKKVAAKMADTGAPEGEAGAVGVPGALSSSSASGESEAVVAVEGGGGDDVRAVSGGAVAQDATAMDTGVDEVAAKEDVEKASTRAESKVSKSKSPTKTKVAVAAAAAAADESTVMDTVETEAQSKDSAEGANAATATAAAGGEAGATATAAAAGDNSEAEAKGHEGADGGENEKPVICPPCSPKSGDKGGEEKEGGEAKVKDEKEGERDKIKEEAKEEENESSDDEEEAVDLATLKDDTSDPDDVMENAYFTTRLEFLDMCIRSHYQFDQLRRSKHTTMMMLYHMHNPDAPKFLPKCDVPTCNMDIMTGHRFHCDSCEVDFCQDCCRKMGSRVHHHVLRAMPVSGTQKVKLTDEQRKERQRSIRVHLQLLQHSSTCTGCRSRHCQKMKEFLKHGANCKMGVKNGCPNCKRIYDLLHWHARSCNKDECPVFKCMEIRAHLKSLLTRQQAMDDRRRHAMNQMYSQGVPGADDN